MGEGFDFRDMLGGASASVEHSEALADGLGGDERAAEAEAIRTEYIRQLPIFLARVIHTNAGYAGVCTICLLAEVVRVIVNAADERTRGHLIGMIGRALSDIEGGERG
jgi:hypothetical protein